MLHLPYIKSLLDDEQSVFREVENFFRAIVLEKCDTRFVFLRFRYHQGYTKVTT